MDPSLLTSVFLIAISGALGQLMVFTTIGLFNCYVLTIITTTRKFFSVLLSSIGFHHNFSGIQWMGAGMVMVCTGLEVFLSGNKKKKTHQN